MSGADQQQLLVGVLEAVGPGVLTGSQLDHGGVQAAVRAATGFAGGAGHSPSQ
jgi:hypothetical protein